MDKVLVGIGVLLVTLVIIYGYALSVEGKECNQYRDWKMEDIPVKCLSYFQPTQRHTGIIFTVPLGGN